MGRMPIDPHWALLEEDGSVMPLARYPVQQVLAGGQPPQGMIVGLRRADDLPQPFWVLIDAYARRDAEGRVEQVVVTFVDITARKLADEELRLLGAAVACLSDVVIITDGPLERDPPPAFVFVNPAFERLTGWRRDEVLGRSPLLLHGPETDAAEARRVGRLLKQGLPAHGELVNYTRDGRPYWVEFNILPLFDRGGRLTHFVSVASATSPNAASTASAWSGRAATCRPRWRPCPTCCSTSASTAWCMPRISPRHDLLVAARGAAGRPPLCRDVAARGDGHHHRGAARGAGLTAPRPARAMRSTWPTAGTGSSSRSRASAAATRPAPASSPSARDITFAHRGRAAAAAPEPFAARVLGRLSAGPARLARMKRLT